MTDGVTNPLESLVGTGKKFASVEDLAKGKLEADTYIEVLKGQINDFKTVTTDLQTKADRTEALEKLMTELNKTNNDGSGNPVVVTPKTTGTQAATLTQDDIVKLIEAREATKQAERNLGIAKAELRKVYGDKTDEVLASKAAALGITVEQVEALGRTSAQAMLNLVGASKQPSTQAVANHSSRNTESLNDTTIGGDIRNAAFYDKLKKEMGTMKFVMDAKIQKQLHRDMSMLGEAWDAA